MKINILAVGNIKENYFAGACEEYSKRLGKFCDINIIEVQEKNKLSTPEQCLLAEAKDIEYIIVFLTPSSENPLTKSPR
mgnify:CR=1 FL=1